MSQGALMVEMSRQLDELQSALFDEDGDPVAQHENRTATLLNGVAKIKMSAEALQDEIDDGEVAEIIAECDDLRSSMTDEDDDPMSLSVTWIMSQDISEKLGTLEELIDFLS